MSKRGQALAAFLVVAAAACVGSSENDPRVAPARTTSSIVAELSSFSPFAHAHRADVTIDHVGDRLRLSSSVASSGASAPLAALVASVPTHAGGTIHVGIEGRDAASIDLTPLDDADVSATIDGNTVVYSDVRAGVDVLHVLDVDRVEEIRILHAPTNEPVVLRYRIALGSDVARLRTSSRVELLDDEGRVLLATDPLFAVDARGVRVPMSARRIGSDVLVLSFDPHGLTAPIAVDPAWTVALAPRGLYTSSGGGAGVVLPNGNALLVGDLSTPTLPEIYDFAQRKWRDSAPLHTGRGNCGVSVLSDGRVLVTGGQTPSGTTSGPALSSAEIYDPVADKWTLAHSLLDVRVNHAQTTLKNGKVLVAGGYASTAKGAPTLKTAELYDPATNTWTSAPTMVTDTPSPYLYALPDGRALLTSSFFYAPSIFDPVKSIWIATTPPTTDFGFPVVLPSGKVLFGSETLSKSAMLYDPTADVWTPTSNVQTPRDYFTIDLLPNGSVLMAAGEDSTLTALSSTEIYDVATDKWSYGPAMHTTRDTALSLRLPNGRIMVVGGFTGDLSTLATPEIFNLVDGSVCKQGNECATGYCVDGVCCATNCLDACSACNVKGSEGTCTGIDGAPIASHATCEPYAKCAKGKCISTCTTDKDCFDGYSCYPESSTCGPAKPTCDGDHTVKLSTGATKDCSPYKCQPTGDCFVECATTDDCIVGFSCVAGVCAQPSASSGGGGGGGGGGCALGDRSGARDAGAFEALALLALFATTRARRRRAV